MPSGLDRMYNALSEPLTDAPSRFGQSIRDYILDPNVDPNEQWFLGPRAFLAGAAEGAGDVASSLTSPLNLGMTALSGGSYGAARAGLPQISRGLGFGAKALGSAVSAHGARTVLDPASSLRERGYGALEMAGGEVPFAPSSRGIPSPVPTIRRPNIGSSVRGIVEEAPNKPGFVKDPAARAAKAALDQEVIKKLPPVTDRRHQDMLRGYASERITGQMPKGVDMSDDMYQRMMQKFDFGGKRSTDPQPPAGRSPMIKSGELSPDYVARLRARPGRAEMERSVITEMMKKIREEELARELTELAKTGRF